MGEAGDQVLGLEGMGSLLLASGCGQKGEGMSRQILREGMGFQVGVWVQSDLPLPTRPSLPSLT